MGIGTPRSLGSNSALTGTVTITTTGAINSGDLVVVMVGQQANSALNPVSSISDGTNTYSKAVSISGSTLNYDLELWYKSGASAVGSSASLVINCTSTTVGSTVATVAAVSGVRTGVPDKTNSNSVSGVASSVSVSTGTLSVPSEIVFGAALMDRGNTPTETASGFTNINFISLVSDQTIYLDYDIVSATTSVTYTPTWSETSSLILLADVATFESSDTLMAQIWL